MLLIMKKSLVVVLFCGSLLLAGQSAVAQDNRIGIGAMINSPTGLSAKVWFSNSLAVDGALSFNISEFNSNIYLHSDVLQHNNAIYSDLLQSYYGLGFRILWSDVTDNITAGLRGPIGITYSYEETSIESFFEIAPTLDFAPDARFFFGGAVGMRIYLN